MIDREPLPTNGPEYHEDHAAWVRRQPKPPVSQPSDGWAVPRRRVDGFDACRGPACRERRMTVEITCYECGEPVRSCDDLFRCSCSRCGICHELTTECVCEDPEVD